MIQARCSAIFCALLSAWSLPAAETSIRVDPSLKQGAISPLIFGVGVEWIDNGDSILDAQTGRIRPDVVAALAPLRIPLWRFPGGILADYYDWRDGVGAPAARALRRNPMDNQVFANSFGTDEFIQLCRRLNADALITANYGSGNLDLALSWQKYFISHGFHVKYWEIGNELYLTQPRVPAAIPGDDGRIFKTSAQYARDFRRWGRALKAADPGAKVGAVMGTYNVSAEHADWATQLLALDATSVDFIALHDAFAPVIIGNYDYSRPENRNAAYLAMYAQPAQTQADISHVRAAFSAKGAAPGIAITEHYPLFGAPTSLSGLKQFLDQTRTLASALYTASQLQAFMTAGVAMANYNVANSPWLGGLLTDAPGGIIKTPTYWVYDLYRNHFGTQLVSVRIEGNPSYSNHALGSVPAMAASPVLRAAASSDSENNLYLAVINVETQATVPGVISVRGLRPGAVAEVRTVSAAQPNVLNGVPFSSTAIPSAEQLAPVVSSWTNRSGADTYQFPPNSMTVFRWAASQN